MSTPRTFGARSSGRGSSAESPSRSVLTHPVVFVAAFTSIGILFAAQEWLHLYHSGYRISAAIVFESWGAQYFIWGIISLGALAALSALHPDRQVPSRF